MTPSTPLQKRIKRHLTGREHRFFAATAPGLEMVCRDELKSFLLPQIHIAAVEGGVEFSGHLPDCYLANLNLRSANRVLMRIRSFHAADFRQLEKNLRDIPWELYLHPGATIQIHATSRQSRLYHKDAIAERVQESISFRFAQNIFPQEPCPAPADIRQIFVRVSQNDFTLSIDSSGELLHKRGIKSHAARAPLRETIAAAALMLAGYTGAEPLIDPMCGSGSFSLEAALMAQQIPPGWYRAFAFMNWPSFQPGRWKHLRRRAEIMFRHVTTPAIFASDRDEQAVSTLKENFSRHGLAGVVAVSTRNFFDFSPKELTDRTGLIALNPPFGRRMGSRQESDALFTAVCLWLKKEYRGWKFALIAPRAALVHKVPFRSTPHMLPLGGIKVSLLTGKIP
ncbi:MAG: hypothetical protein P1P89_19815 [Desulfobacterales bacterium]|nr:hypothetical protein [Desulfobacterales bacterium]